MKVTTANSRKLMFLGIFAALSGTTILIASDLTTDATMEGFLFRTGLTLVVLGFLLTMLGTGFYFLARKGSNVFAINLLFFYLGLGIIAVPILLQIFAITITDPILSAAVIGSGIVLALFGFFGEYAQLNQWFLERIQLIVKQFKILKMKINWRLVLHPAHVLTVISMIIISSWISGFLPLHWWLILAGVVILEVLNIMLVFPEIPRLLKLSILTFFAALVKGLHWSLLHLGEFISWMKEWLIKSFQRVIAVITFILRERGLIYGGLGLTMLVALKSYMTASQVLVAIFVVLLTTVLLVVLQHPQLGSTIVTESRATAFKVKTRIQVRRTPRALATCYHCTIQLKKPYPKECPNCLAPQYSCMVCNGLIHPRVLVACPHCESPAHSDHLLQWLQIKPKCPHCRQPLQLEAIKQLTIPHLNDKESSITAFT